MLEHLFSKQNQTKKSVLDSDAAGGTAAQPATLAKTNEDEWKTHQQKVSSKSRNLYTVEDDPNEQALNGDGYSVKNGKIKSASTFFKNEASKETVDNGGKPLKAVEHAEPGLVLKAGTTPKLDQLVKEDEKDGTPVQSYRGTVDAPNVSKDVSDKYLFANGGPDQNDVKQVGVGDCYFWATVLQIVAHDPGKFTSMMKLNNGTVSTTMYHKEGKKWVAGTISRPIGIGGLNAQYDQNKSKYDSRECGVRLDTSSPVEAAWNAVIMGPMCMINRKDYYKAALWANCLEQAYSDFSRAHGKYGAGQVEAENSGNEEFEGGCSDSCFHMFYGDKAKGPGTYAVKDTKSGRKQFLKSLIEFKKTLDSGGGYSALVARRAFGDPNTGSAHAYSVMNVTFKDKNGKVIDFTDNKGIFGGVSDFFERRDIDTTQSKLLLRNPWNSNSTETEGKFFEVTLEEFITSSEWTHVREATVKTRG